MKIPFLSSLGLVPALLVLVGCETPQNSRSTRDLFNGRNLEGWQAVSDEPGGAETWAVRDGVIVCQGEPLGHLVSLRDFSDFRLLVEYRWPSGKEPGNSGIFLRINGPARALPRCVEVQLKHGNAGDLLGLQGMTIAENQPRFFTVRAHPLAGDIRGVSKLSDQERPVGEWNVVEIVAEGSTFTVRINGTEVNRAEGVEVLSGPIGLQSEGGEIQFRRVTLTPL